MVFCCSLFLLLLKVYLVGQIFFSVRDRFLSRGVAVLIWAIWKTQNNACFNRVVYQDPATIIHLLTCREHKCENHSAKGQDGWCQWLLKFSLTARLGPLVLRLIGLLQAVGVAANRSLLQSSCFCVEEVCFSCQQLSLVCPVVLEELLQRACGVVSFPCSCCQLGVVLWLSQVEGALQGVCVP